MADHEAQIHRQESASGVAPGSMRCAQWDQLASRRSLCQSCIPVRRSKFVTASGRAPDGRRRRLLVEDHVFAFGRRGSCISQGRTVRVNISLIDGWAEAWERAGGQYYPKLQISVPFTPVPGRRLLGSRPQQLLAAAEAVTEQNELSSRHITFINQADRQAEGTERRGWLIRARHPVSLVQS